MKRAILCFVLAVAMPSLSQGGEPSEKYTPTKMEWLVVLMNMGLYNFSGDTKPECSAIENEVFCTPVLVTNKAHGERAKKALQDSFDKHVRKLDLSGKVRLVVDVTVQK